jgi:hypothetical protein
MTRVAKSRRSILEHQTLELALKNTTITIDLQGDTGMPACRHRTVTDYLMEAPARCCHCLGEITEKTLVIALSFE